MPNWYMFEFDDRDNVEVYLDFQSARNALAFQQDVKHIKREDNGLYKSGRWWIGTRSALIKNGFDNVRFKQI